MTHEVFSGEGLNTSLDLMKKWHMVMQDRTQFVLQIPFTGAGLAATGCDSCDHASGLHAKLAEQSERYDEAAEQRLLRQLAEQAECSTAAAACDGQ